LFPKSTPANLNVIVLNVRNSKMACDIQQKDTVAAMASRQVHDFRKIAAFQKGLY